MPLRKTNASYTPMCSHIYYCCCARLADVHVLLFKVRVGRAPQQRRARGELLALERRALHRVLHVQQRLPGASGQV